MVRPRIQEGRGGYHQEDAKYVGAGKEKKGEAQEEWLDNIKDDMKEYKMTQTRSVWHTKTNAGPSLHGRCL